MGRDRRGAGRPHAALCSFGGCRVALTEVINALPPNPSLAWTSSNPGWEFQAFGWGQEKPALLADSTSPCELPGQEQRGGSQVLLTCVLLGKQEPRAPTLQEGALSPEALPPSERGEGSGDATCQRVKSH